MTRTRIFWSIYCLLLGLILLIKILFRLDFSGWTIAFALLLLESGVFLLTGGFGMRIERHATGSGDYVFFNGDLALDEQASHARIVFSNARIDLMPPVQGVTRIVCVFGSATVRIPQDYAVRATCTAAFGQISTPKGTLNGFGDRVFLVGDGIQSQLEVCCLFGQVTLND